MEEKETIQKDEKSTNKKIVYNLGLTKEEILEQLFDNNTVVWDLYVIPKKAFLKIELLTADDHLSINKKLSDMSEKLTNLSWFQKYGLIRLAHAARVYSNNKIHQKFENPDDAHEYLKKEIPGCVLERLVGMQRQFEQEVKKAINPEEIEQTFFEKGGSQKNQEPSQKE